MCIGSRGLIPTPMHLPTAAAPRKQMYIACSPPRVLATHLPFSLLPERITAGCHIVYVCREPKDALVSWWWFNTVKTAAADGAQLPFPFEEAFELFCQGRSGVGPQWADVHEYWKESVARPLEVLFLEYEEMLRDPAGDLKRLAEFLGCSFSEAEQEARAVDAILELCSLDKQKSLEVNKNGTDGKGVFRNKWFLRKGIAGDWSNHVTPAMAARLDKIVEEELQGSGFTFASSR